MRLAPGQYEYLHALGIEVYKLRERESQKGTGLKPVPDRTQDTDVEGTDLKSVPGCTPDTGVIDEDRSVRAGGIAVQGMETGRLLTGKHCSAKYPNAVCARCMRAGHRPFSAWAT